MTRYYQRRRLKIMSFKMSTLADSTKDPELSHTLNKNSSPGKTTDNVIDVSEEGSMDIFGNGNDDCDDKVEIKYDNYERTSHKNCDTMDNESISVLRLALVKRHHSLWAEYIYNAARVLANMIDRLDIVVEDKKCLELGAGAGLPSLIASLNGANEVVISDYGHEFDRSLIAAIDINIEYIRQYVIISNPSCVIRSVEYIWGYPVNKLLNAPDRKETRDESNDNDKDRFDFIFLADLLFNRSEHKKLLWTVKQCLKSTGQAIVTFSHHDPMKAQLDLKFFEYANDIEYNFLVEKISEVKRSSYPFVENDGYDDLRGYVYIYRLTHRSSRI